MRFYESPGPVTGLGPKFPAFFHHCIVKSGFERHATLPASGLQLLYLTRFCCDRANRKELLDLARSLATNTLDGVEDSSAPGSQQKAKPTSAGAAGARRLNQQATGTRDRSSARSPGILRQRKTLAGLSTCISRPRAAESLGLTVGSPGLRILPSPVFGGCYVFQRSLTATGGGPTLTSCRMAGAPGGAISGIPLCCATRLTHPCGCCESSSDRF